jgi:hypothetical protein
MLVAHASSLPPYQISSQNLSDCLNTQVNDMGYGDHVDKVGKPALRRQVPEYSWR